MSSVEPKVPGFATGEYVRDAADPRFLAILPRVKDEPDQTYLARLQHNGLAVVISREELTKGGYPRALAKAITLGVPTICPYDENEVRPTPQEAKPPIDMIEFRRQAAQREADPGLRSIHDTR